MSHQFGALTLLWFRVRGARTRQLGAEPAAAHTEPTSAQIAERAYFLFLERQGPGGPLDDWLQAERELRNGSCPA